MAKLPAQDIVERLRERAKRMNGALVGASDGGTYALGYYDQFAAADDKEAADTISRLTADNEALRTEAEAFRGKLAEACGKLMVAEARVTAFYAEVGRLRKQLLRHGAHARDCERPRGPECDCGWDDLRAALANEDAGQ